VREGVAWIGYAAYQPGIEGADHLRGGAAAIGFNMMRELCRALPDEVLLSRRPPADARPYRRFFRVPVRFDAEQSALVFPARALERPVPGAGLPMRATLEEAVAKYWTVALPNVTDQVVQMLHPRVLFGDSSLEAVADCLKMHPRTLNRRLRAERTTFRKLLSEARFDMARQLLAGTRMDVSGISGALGYAETSGFTHAFHHMAGTSLAEWRAGLAEDALTPPTSAPA
jgi:AraC-like DNA-binding protein